MAWLPLLAALGCALVGGVFFAFSTFVMRALLRLPPEQGAAAMQSINREVLRPPFLGLFLGTAMVCAALLVATWGAGGTGWPIVGSVLYLAGTFGVTVALNVPLNDQLAARGVEAWSRYGATWTRWNHVRTVASVAAAAAFLLAHTRS